MHQLELGEALRDDPTEAVRVKVEECSVRQQAQLCGEVPGDVSVVQINAGDDTQGRVVECRGTKHSIVGTHMRADPVPSGIERVRVHGLLPSLEGDIGPPKPLVRESHLDVDLVLEVLGEIIILLERQELTAGDVGRLGIGEGEGEGGEGGEEEGEEEEAARGRHVDTGTHWKPPWSGPRLLIGGGVGIWTGCYMEEGAGEGIDSALRGCTRDSQLVPS